jgi:hypothetical protein
MELIIGNWLEASVKATIDAALLFIYIFFTLFGFPTFAN